MVIASSKDGRSALVNELDVAASEPAMVVDFVELAARNATLQQALRRLEEQQRFGASTSTIRSRRRMTAAIPRTGKAAADALEAYVAYLSLWKERHRSAAQKLFIPGPVLRVNASALQAALDTALSFVVKIALEAYAGYDLLTAPPSLKRQRVACGHLRSEPRNRFACLATSGSDSGTTSDTERDEDEDASSESPSDGASPHVDGFGIAATDHTRTTTRRTKGVTTTASTQQSDMRHRVVAMACRYVVRASISWRIFQECRGVGARTLTIRRAQYGLERRVSQLLDSTFLESPTRAAATTSSCSTSPSCWPSQEHMKRWNAAMLRETGQRRILRAVFEWDTSRSWPACTAVLTATARQAQLQRSRRQQVLASIRLTADEAFEQRLSNSQSWRQLCSDHRAALKAVRRGSFRQSVRQIELLLRSCMTSNKDRANSVRQQLQDLGATPVDNTSATWLDVYDEEILLLPRCSSQTSQLKRFRLCPHTSDEILAGSPDDYSRAAVLAAKTHCHTKESIAFVLHKPVYRLYIHALAAYYGLGGTSPPKKISTRTMSTAEPRMRAAH